jgi:RNA polymerase sigma factor (sigma-70 family)
MSSTTQLVEHFFRHEYGRIVAVMTSRMGAANLQLIEDAVHTAMSRALSNWPRSGVPDNPPAWLYRSSVNAAVDALRHQKMVTRTLAEYAETSQSVSLDTCRQLEYEVGDETLRLLFLCCHWAIPAESRVALALRTVGGFSTHEIAAGLLTSAANIEKRITRAKEKLREHQAELVVLDRESVADRLESVQFTIYLMFNEGFAASSGSSPIREELCDEAIRLSRMLNLHPQCAQPTSAALLSLLLLHSARLNGRVDSNGSIILLADQNRTLWNWTRVREAMDWMDRSAQGEQLSRYHIEAAIAWEHSRAPQFADTDWQRIVELYELLQDRFVSPAVRLNLAIAVSYAQDVSSGLGRLLQITDEQRRVLRPWWDCAMAQLLERNGQPQAAISHWRDAIALATNTAQRAMIQRHLDSQSP